MLRSAYEGTCKGTGGTTNGRSDCRAATRDGSQRRPARGPYRAAAQGSLLGRGHASASKHEHG